MLRQLMADETLRRQLGERARAYCAERYSREKILDQWEALLTSCYGCSSGQNIRILAVNTANY